MILMRNSILFSFFLLPFIGIGQNNLVHPFELDSLLHQFVEETVITATRADRALSNVTVPTTVIQAKAIQQTGLLKLNEVLQEQTGLTITSTVGSSAIGGGIFGNGVQIQGMAPDYTLIMLDGEPIIGRQGGVLDLARFTVGNIRKIEIVKGPSSALYGSEAMGGVVNILTDQRRINHFKTTIRYSNMGMADLFGSFNREIDKSSLYVFANANVSNGYDLTPETSMKTIDPHQDYVGQIRWTYRFTDRTRLTWSNRFFRGIQRSTFMINNESQEILGEGITTDINVNPVLNHRWNDKITSTLRLYASKYRYDQQLNIEQTGEAYYADDFIQEMFKIEKQSDWDLTKNFQLIGGIGYINQAVQTKRYREKQTQDVSYLFMQMEWKYRSKWIIIPGLRYDNNSAYSSRVSPKVSVQYKLTEQSHINLSYGSGFKAPDFRQLYLSYANPAAQGYRIYGTNEFSVETLEKEKSDGLISVILPEAYQISTLSPEVSHGFNVAYHQKLPSNDVRFDVNIFYNDVTNLINYLPVAIQPNGSFVFSYKNTKRAFTTGLECNLSGAFKKHIVWNVGYQFLFSGEQAILNNIKNNEVYGRDTPLGSARLMKWNDYTGLLGRSPHMFNAKVAYNNSNSGWGGTSRLVYRSRWGVVDMDGNGFANMDEEFAQGFVNANVSIQKHINQKIMVQLAANNILNHQDELNSPQMPGTHFIATIMCNFSKL
ncbi:MAG: TonB-dependent receptor [Saprospiraceae bacterium]